MTLFRRHFLRKQDKEWEEAKEEEMEEKLSSFEKNSIHLVELTGKDDNYRIFGIITNVWFNDIFPRKTGSHSQALEEQYTEKTLSAPQ